MKKVGVVLNKHMPIHNGHLYLCKFASTYVDELIIGVCSKRDEPIDGSLRTQWTKQLLPEATVVHCPDMVERYKSLNFHEDDPRLWALVVTDFIGRSDIDFVFASEDYGPPLAKELGAQFVPVDYLRDTVPISATLIRNNPMANWRYIPYCVRPHFLKRICFVGPPHSGTHELAKKLAERYDTLVVPEYSEVIYGKDPYTEKKFEDIVRGQVAAEESLSLQANRVLFCASDTQTAGFWSRELLGKELKIGQDRKYDLRLFVERDVPLKFGKTHSDYLSWRRFANRLKDYMLSQPDGCVVINEDNGPQLWQQALMEIEKVVGF